MPARSSRSGSGSAGRLRVVDSQCVFDDSDLDPRWCVEAAEQGKQLLHELLRHPLGDKADVDVPAVLARAAAGDLAPVSQPLLDLILDGRAVIPEPGAGNIHIRT